MIWFVYELGNKINWNRCFFSTVHFNWYTFKLSCFPIRPDGASQRSFQVGYINAGDQYWRLNMFVRTLKCWWQLMPPGCVTYTVQVVTKIKIVIRFKSWWYLVNIGDMTNTYTNVAYQVVFISPNWEILSGLR